MDIWTCSRYLLSSAARIGPHSDCRSRSEKPLWSSSILMSENVLGFTSIESLAVAVLYSRLNKTSLRSLPRLFYLECSCSPILPSLHMSRQAMEEISLLLFLCNFYLPEPLFGICAMKQKRDASALALNLKVPPLCYQCKRVTFALKPS